MDFTATTRIKLTGSQSSSVLGNETIVLNYEVGNYYELNEIGSFIWSLIQTNGEMTVGDIETKLLDEFDVEQEVCREELTEFLNHLLNEKLIETVE
ncbi:hypothetical protein BN8_03155 [Fibrisoma limi BUZ 3]|uniref:Coenzyme PQQ synthesis protein D (PqqD) n=1 Tax=Fibrisoma limi BUZ 3 TaxID=1185876 RepID=I2GJE2_9BACT|nr:PqqD family peptide modification chaperone [Fibrisoma limi]CCH54017.1 hypothetical protein BN8_03155 [Fibrisoma limi BUZ 3]